MGYSPIVGRFLQRDPVGYLDTPNLYESEGSNPANIVDPFGLQELLGPTSRPTTGPTTQPVAGPTVGPVTTMTGPGTQYSLTHHGPQADFYQTIEISALPCCKIPPQAALREAAEHGGNDPTTRPVADNPTGDPKKPYGNVLRGTGTTTMRDAPNFDDPSYPSGFQGQKKGHIKVVCKGKVVAEFDYVTTATARAGGSTVLTPSPTTKPTTGPTTQPTTQH